MTSPSHVPVLLDRVVALLAPALDHDGAVLVDATLGLGGHTEAVLQRCALARVVGIDRDPRRWRWPGSGWRRTHIGGARFTGVHAVYDEIPDVLDDLGLDAVDAVLFDLGVSSLQLDVVERGFAYREDAPLDMRMDGTTGPTAADVLNTYPARRPGQGAEGLRGGEVRPPDRTSRREGPRDRPVHHLGPAGRAPVRRHPGARAAHGRPPRQAHLPGPAHGGQRGAGGAAARPAGRHRRHRRRRPRRRGVLPLAGGPAGQAGLRRRRRAATSPRTSRSSRGPRAGLPAADPRRREGRRRPRSTTTRVRPASGCAPSNDSPLPRTEESHKK